MVPFSRLRVSCADGFLCRLETRWYCRGNSPIHKFGSRRIQIAIICEYHSCGRKHQYPRVSRKTTTRSPYHGTLKLPRPDNRPHKVLPLSFYPSLSLPFALSLLSATFPRPRANAPTVTDTSPVTCAWEGGAALVSVKKNYASKIVT